MWQRFTERVRRVLFFAQEEAARYGVNYVGTEHLLLGIVRASDSVAARILEHMGVDLGRVREEIERQAARGDGRLGQEMQLTPAAKRVIDRAYEEARQLDNNYIGTEHLLLGLAQGSDDIAVRVLHELGADIERTHREVRALHDDRPDVDPPQVTAGGTPTAPLPGDPPDAMYRLALHTLCTMARDTGTEEELRSALRDLLEELERPGAD